MYFNARYAYWISNLEIASESEFTSSIWNCISNNQWRRSHMIHTWLTLSKDLLSICVLNLFLKWLCSVHHVGTKYPIRYSVGCKEISLSMMKVKDHNLCRRGITWRSKMPKVSPGTLPLLYSWKFMKIQDDRQYKTRVMPQRYLKIPMFAKYN